MRNLIPLLLFACVPGVDLEDAPCPCAAGWTCCETLSICVPDGATCPGTLPPSSNAPCTSNDECRDGEACAAWSSDGVLSGPLLCKKTCSSLACDDRERCLFSFQDGLPADELSIARLCLPADPPQECVPWRCEGCPGLELGQTTTCENGASEILGCVFALHPECGLKCELALVGNCIGVTSPCEEYSCARCPEGKPGVVTCRENRSITCLASAGDECDLLCAEVEIGSCE